MTERGNPNEDDGAESPTKSDLKQYVMDVMGWNSYQASAYVALVRDGPLEPKDIVAMTDVPQGRVYDIMSSLEGEYVIVQGAQPKRYQAQHPRSVLGDMREAFIEKADSAIDHLEQQYEIQLDRQEPRHPAWVIPGMGGVKRELIEAIRTSEAEIKLVDRDGRWIQKGELEDLQDKVNNDVSVEVIGRPQWEETLTKLASMAGCPTWKADGIDSSFILIDDDVAIMRTGRGDTGTKIEDTGTVKTLERAFRMIRNEADRVTPDV